MVQSKIVVPASQNIILNPPKPPPLWGPQSNVIGEAISAILKRDRSKFDMICAKLHGKQLPGNLRKFLWKDVLFSPDRKRLHKIEVEDIVRDTFTQILDRNVLELGLYKPTRSTIGGLILNGVVDCYAKCTAMKNFRTEANIKDTSGALNVLYVYERTYEPYLIYWIFPLQVAFQVTDEDEHDFTDLERVDHAIDLAVYLDLFNSSFFPRWPEIFAIAELVMQILSEEDPDLFTHLKAIAINDVRVNKKGFVSVLDTPSVIFIWDQCFMQMWRPSVLRHFALAMLELLRGNFMLEEDYLGMRRHVHYFYYYYVVFVAHLLFLLLYFYYYYYYVDVFLEDSRRIFTTDLQRAWLHLESGNDLMEIPYLNRQFAYLLNVSAVLQSVLSEGELLIKYLLSFAERN
ncbi:hypothetical protein KUTeg_010422 [Tegillarca granosa]|uniref:Rab-GAP TBC domain-containing protein n=1 Tax=Tegillarca granosa TaxID=220873 RepID=A0ABQ9F6V3_TEGGR|nr:hypothetical protein KUTeg_010422 [Tegillarca granosa]